MCARVFHGWGKVQRRLGGFCPSPHGWPPGRHAGFLSNVYSVVLLR